MAQPLFQIRFGDQAVPETFVPAFKQVLGKHLSYEARSQLFRKIVELDMVYFDNTMTGNTTSKLTNDVNPTPEMHAISTVLQAGETVYDYES